MNRDHYLSKRSRSPLRVHGDQQGQQEDRPGTPSPTAGSAENKPVTAMEVAKPGAVPDKKSGVR